MKVASKGVTFFVFLHHTVVSYILNQFINRLKSGDYTYAISITLNTYLPYQYKASILLQ